MNLVENLKISFNNFLDNLALSELQERVRLVMREREELKAWTNEELKLATLAFKQDLAKGKDLDLLVVQSFAVVCEAARRIFGKIPYEVQILAGMVIHSGKVAEMKAGEGKTLTETMPVYLNALTGKGVHIITTNDYLAERDAKQMGKLYDFLGLTWGYVTSTMSNDERRQAYAKDITYVTNQEVGFDYLRDNLVYSKTDRVLRSELPLNFGIVDEIDSILIDESRTPLIIAEGQGHERNFYDVFTDAVNYLEDEVDYKVDYKHKNASFTDLGLEKLEKILGQPVFSETSPMNAFYLDVCLRAKVLFEKDRDYIVTPEGVEIVDEFTGRVLPGRRFTDGVHQAIEAKEKVEIKDSDKTMAAVTFQNFFPMYKKLSGMSGTVMRSRDEFNHVYKLDVIQIPTHKPIVRVEHQDLFFKTEKGKFLGVMKKVKQIHAKGQPILIGARNVEVAHKISEFLEQTNFPFQLLTAADHKAEAEKIEKAGKLGMITVATNMAGRGTDILLEPGVMQTGGLFVIGTERHESRRIDDQLSGRSGRQGDPGESLFCISMEDEIMQLFGSESIIDAMEEMDFAEDEYISGKSLSDSFKKAQDFVESKNYDSRIYLYKYDRVISTQRNWVYSVRNKLLDNPEEFVKFCRQALKRTVYDILNLGSSKEVEQKLIDTFGYKKFTEDLKMLVDSKPKKSKKIINEYLNPLYNSFLYQGKLNEAASNIATELWQTFEKMQKNSEIFNASQMLLLQTMDRKWSQHLDLMDILKEESNLLSYASEEPLIEFISESKRLFENMEKEIEQDFFTILYKKIQDL